MQGVDQDPTRRTVRDPEDGPVPRVLCLAASWSWRLLVVAALGYVLLRVVAYFTLLVIPVLIGVLVVALVRPLADVLAGIRIGRHTLPRSLAALLTVLLTLAVIAGLIALIGQQIAIGFPTLRDQAADGLTDLQRRLATSPLHLTSEQLNGYVDEITSRLRTDSGQVVSGAVQVTSRAADIGTGFFIVLFSTYFFLSGGDRIWAWLVGLLPRRARGRAHVAGTLAWATLTSFVRATVIVALVDGVGVGLVAWGLGVPLPVPLGVLVFLGAFVPIVGALVSGSAAVLVALVAQGPVVALLMLVGVLLVQQLEAHVLQPFLLGRAVRVHPLGVILAIGAGVLLAGIPGALFAVPVAAVANVVISYLARGDGTPPDGVLARTGAGGFSWPRPGIGLGNRFAVVSSPAAVVGPGTAGNEAGEGRPGDPSGPAGPNGTGTGGAGGTGTDGTGAGGAGGTGGTGAGDAGTGGTDDGGPGSAEGAGPDSAASWCTDTGGSAPERNRDRPARG